MTKKWELNINDAYYTPALSGEDLVNTVYWVNSYWDKLRLKRNLVCRTKAEAIRKAKLMLKAIKELK